MADVGHSALLKFFADRPDTTMSENKIELTPIESKVPGEQLMRDVKEASSQKSEREENATVPAEEENAANVDFVYSPVITVTKAEATFTKGDLKLQKVVVSEDISDDSTSTDGNMLSVTDAYIPPPHTEIHSEVLSVSIRTDPQTTEHNIEEEIKDEDQSNNQESIKATKIPKLKLKQVIEKIRKENEAKRNDSEVSSGPKVRSSIPRLKDLKNPQQNIPKDTIQNKKDQEVESPKLDDEFDKLYEEIIENEASNNVASPEKISDPVKLQSKFEEIIHAYDENKAQPIIEEKPKSKIPLLKRKSEHEIEVLPQSTRKNSLKKSNADVFKGKIPVATEKTMQSNIGTIEHENNTEIKTYESNAFEEITSKDIKTSGNVNIIAKTITTQKSSEELVNISSTENHSIVQSENIRNTNEKDTLECKIPVASDSKENIIPKIYSATLNKHPTRINVIEKISSQQYISDSGDKTLYRSISHHASNVESSANLHQKNISRISSMPNIDNKVLKKQQSLLQESQKDAHFTSKTLQMEENVSVKQYIHTAESRQNILDMPTLSSSLTKFEKMQKDVSSENLLKQNNLKSTAEKYDSNASHLPENIQRLRVTDQFETIENSARKVDISTSVRSHHNNATYKSENKNENKYSSSESSGFVVKQGVTSSLNTSKSTIVSDEAFTSIFDNELTLVNIKEETEAKDITAYNPFTISTNTGDKDNKDENENEINEITTVSDKTNKNNLDSNEIKVENENSQTTNKSELTTLESSIISFVNETITVKETEPNIVYEKEQVENLKQRDNETVLEKENAETKNNKLEHDFSTPITTVGGTAEEDISELKGKVNRIIKRLDSKDSKEYKKDIDDVPKEVSVISKIAIFEKSDSTNVSLKENVTAEYQVIESNTRLPNQDVVVNDKPKVVNEILKTSNQNNLDFNQNESNYIDEYAENSKSSNAITNNYETNKITKTENKRDFKTTRSVVDTKKIHKAVSNAAFHSNEVFVKRDDEMSSLDVWNEYRRKKELESDLRRAKSLAELDLGDAVRGKVKQMVVRMNSVDRMSLARREVIDLKEKPRLGSVSQRIALFERKLTPIRGDDHSHRTTFKATTAESKGLDEEELAKRIAELSSAKDTYGPFDDITFVELNDGAKMPAVAIGTALLDPKLIKPVISAAIELGFRAFDTAYIYGNEKEVGQAIRDKIQDGTVTREELFITNKLWSTFHRRELAEKACRQSLEAMGLDYFDLYLIHNPMSLKEGSNPLPKIANVLQYSQHDYLEAWFGIERLVGSGLIRRGGVSNFNSVQLDRIVEKGRIKPVINQVECHPYLTQLRLEEFCLSRNVKLSCFGVLGAKGTPAELTSGLAPAIDDPLVQVMAAGLAVTPAQLLIGYQVQQGRAAVVKCSSAAHLRDARAPAQLDAAQVAALAALNRNKRIYTFKGMGDTHRNYPFRIPF